MGKFLRRKSTIAFLMALPLALSLALLSCHVIEMPAMRLRRTAEARVRYIMNAVFEDPRSARAAVFGAKAAFILGATLILLSDTHWWHFSASMGELLLGVIAGSVLAMTLSRAAARTRFGAIVGGGDL